MRSYLNGTRSPDQVAFELQCVVRTYMERWQRERILLLGYSRGADIAPFVAARWPAELRERVNLVALVAMSRAANFHFICSIWCDTPIVPMTFRSLRNWSACAA